jgi:hypothetical protein
MHRAETCSGGRLLYKSIFIHYDHEWRNCLREMAEMRQLDHRSAHLQL